MRGILILVALVVLYSSAGCGTKKNDPVGDQPFISAKTKPGDTRKVGIQ